MTIDNRKFAYGGSKGLTYGGLKEYFAYGGSKGFTHDGTNNRKELIKKFEKLGYVPCNFPRRTGKSTGVRFVQSKVRRRD